ncbi:hypothetical protein QFC21_007376 [Naganishia friedmannii]|uniref:Uncharacterized protein n=1 Tax=Naganishia friedmannii TaxID=89922 RepID=A0ACC2UV66_9TREE|nr:hypothetical protein QFC21_007376 [Naganishia friedmannii]
MSFTYAVDNVPALDHSGLSRASRSLTTIPSGGRFKGMTKKSMMDHEIRVPHDMVSLEGITNLGYKGLTFYGSFANYNRKLQAAPIKNIIYPNYDMVHLVESSDGTVIAKGNAEFSDAIYYDVQNAIEEYWASGNLRRVQPHCIKRYFAFYVCEGVFRKPMCQFLTANDQNTIRFCEGLKGMGMRW